jgi:hypothetical protein
MSLIWMGTGALMVFITFPFIMVAEALASRSSDADAVLIARSWARMWADTVLFGFFWGLGLFLTFSFRMSAKRCGRKPQMSSATPDFIHARLGMLRRPRDLRAR